MPGTPRASAVAMLRRTRGRRRASTMSTAVATTTRIASAIPTAVGNASAANPTTTSAIAARGDGLTWSSGYGHGGDRGRDRVVGGVALELGFGAELEPVAQHGGRDRDDIVGRYEVAAREPRRRLGGREQVHRAARARTQRDARQLARPADERDDVA